VTNATRPSIARHRPPRVLIQYEVELYGSKKTIELPFVMGVFASLSGKPAEPLPAVSDRKFLVFDSENFDNRVAAAKPRVAFQVPNTLTFEGNLAVELTFERLDDFSPGAIARRVEPLNALLDTRKRLAALSARAEEGSDVDVLLRRALREPDLLKRLADPGDEVLEVFKMRRDDLRDAVIAEVSAFAAQALTHPDPIALARWPSSPITAMIDRIDQQLSRQMHEILHHPDLQQLEGTWRGLYHLVSGTETDELLKIRVFNISKNELGKTLKRYKGTSWDQSPIFKLVFEAEFGQFGGEPFGCLIGDYYIDHGPADVEILQEMAKIAAAAHAPFISGLSPAMLGMDSWQELGNPRDLLKIHMTPEYAAWREFRESDDARYIGLTLPRYLARLPYGARTKPIGEFSYEEDTGTANHSRYTWANSAYAWAVNLTRAFKLYGWCARIGGIETGGIVEGLPIHTFPDDDGGVSLTCPTEIAISDRRAAELERLGFLALVHRKYSSFAAFTNTRSVQKPLEYDDSNATVDANLIARLPYTLAAGRFAHYIHCIVRDKADVQASHHDMQELLREWLAAYVDGDPAHSPEAVKARTPLASAEVVVEEVEGNPGFYSAKIFLRPHYQLEPLTRSIRLMARLPATTSGR
jgi:type VI secretion system protein ImpC